MSDKSHFTFPFLSILALIFITLKLCGSITWSWWWVTAPLWGGFALTAIFVIIGLIFFFLEKLIDFIIKKIK